MARLRWPLAALVAGAIALAVWHGSTPPPEAPPKPAEPPAPPIEAPVDEFIDPESAPALAARADARVRLGDFDGAFADYRRALEIDPDYADARLGLAWAWRRHGAAQVRAGSHARLSLREAVAAADAAIALDERGYAARGLALVDLAVEMRRIGEAADFTEALRDFDRFDSPVGRGLVLMAQGDYAGAMAAFADEPLHRADARRLSAPSSDEALRLAIDDYSAALALDPIEAHHGRGLARRMLAQLLQERDEDGRPLLRDAAVDFTQALKRDPKFAAAYEDRGLTLQSLAVAEINQGEASAHLFEAALRDFERCLEIVPERFASLANAAYVAAILRDRERAIRYSEAALKLDPQNAKLREIFEDAKD